MIAELFRRLTGKESSVAGVYPRTDGREGWVVLDVDEHARPTRLDYADTEAEGRAVYDGWVESGRRFWRQKVAWKDAGDRTGQREGRDVLRVGGEHYVASWEGVRKDHNEFLGFGGRVFRWRWLDEPEGTFHESNCLWFQGRIDDEFRAALPDNAVFLPVPCRTCGVAGDHAPDCASSMARLRRGL